MDEKQLKLLESTIFLKEALRVKKNGKDVEKAIIIGLKKANAIAKEKGYTPVKSESELKKLREIFKASFDATNKTAFSPAFLNADVGDFKVINGQLVLTNEGPTKLGSIRGAVAVYRDKKGKVKTIKIKFKDQLKMSGKMKEKK
ncbi:hypothetical protein Bp8pS_214 [Bacillus phage vB_BpuM-BpSp]|nr:hypothetical protein Bp8pS_214 [Bacillus phage vB_BpuM-BpSp]